MVKVAFFSGSKGWRYRKSDGLFFHRKRKKSIEIVLHKDVNGRFRQVSVDREQEQYYMQQTSLEGALTW